MIDKETLQEIVETSTMIVGGYAFTAMTDGNIRVVALHGDNHACIMRENSEVLETNMDDIELEIVNKYWQRNKQILNEEVAYA